MVTCYSKGKQVSVRSRAVLLSGVAGIILTASANSVSAKEAALAPEPTRTIDLATARLNEQAVLGRTVAGVTAALGRPALRVRGTKRYTLRYDSLPPSLGSWGLTVLFRREGRLRAYSVAITDPRLMEERLGRILRLKPTELQREVLRAYGDRYRLISAYRCHGVTARTRCHGELGSRDAGDATRIAFGILSPQRPKPARLYLVVYRAR